MLLLTLALSAAPVPSALQGTTWTLVQSGTEQVSGAQAPTLRLSGASASGFAGCNQWQAAVNRKATQLTFSKLSLTRRACEPAMMRAENDFVRRLSGVTSYRLRGQTLALYAGNKQQLVFRTEASPAPAPSTGGTVTPTPTPAALLGEWQVVTLKTSQPVKLPPSAHLTLSAGAAAGTLSLSGKLDCNQISASVTLRGDQLSVSGVALSRMLCPNMAGEQALTALLRQPVQVSVQGEQMTWKNAAGELTLRRTGSGTALKPAGLEGKTFVLKSFSGTLPRTERPIQLSFEASRLSGDDGCNTFFGPYSFGSDGRLSVGSLGSTYTMCPPNYPPLTALLVSRPRVTLSGKTLTLEGTGGRWVFEQKN